MEKRFYRGLQGIFLLVNTILSVASCTVIYEDRADCPCALSVEICGLPSSPVMLSVSGNGFREEREVFRDTTLLIRVPKSGIRLLAVAGASLPQDALFSIPQGSDAPPLYLYSGQVETARDSARVNLQLHKHFCTLSLSIGGPAGWGEPYWAEIRGRVGALTQEGMPVEGDFSCRLDAGNSIRLPRQTPEGELWLDIAMPPDHVVRSFALGNYMLESGFDWTAPDLADLPLEIDLSVTTLTFRTDCWSRVLPLEVDI